MTRVLAPPLPPATPDTVLRIVGTTDLGAALVPMRATYGETGTCAGIAALLEEERERRPTIWLDAGDLTVGPAMALLDERPWSEMAGPPIAAIAAGNRDFDDGGPALRSGARELGHRMLCANIDVGLPPSALLDTPAGPLGAIGIAHPDSHRFTKAPPPTDGWAERVVGLARDLRADGARWVVALLHDGVTWWPSPDAGEPPIRTRCDYLAAVSEPWAAAVDLIVGGRNFGAWTGSLHGTPAGEAHVFAASVVVFDLPEPPAAPVVRGVFRAPALRPARSTAAVEAYDAAAARVVGESAHEWLTCPGAPNSLPDLIADAFRRASGADAAFVPPTYHCPQAPLDGIVASLPAGPVSELDVVRLCPAADYGPVIAELRPGELRAAAARHAATADPAAREHDHLWWNWCRLPAAVSAAGAEPATVAVVPGVVDRLSAWLGRAVDAHPAGVNARDALIGALA